MTPEEAMTRLEGRWREFTRTEDFKRRMALAQEIARIDAEAAE